MALAARAHLTGQSLNLNGGISVADAAGETANLTITGGSLLSGAASNSFRFGYSYIGDCNNSTGTMTLDGANWSNSASHLDVGGSGTGTLTLKDNANLNLFNGTLALDTSASNTFSGGLYINGGTVQISSDLNLGANAGNANGVTFDGGILEATAGINFSSTRVFTVNTGDGTFYADAGTVSSLPAVNQLISGTKATQKP